MPTVLLKLDLSPPRRHRRRRAHGNSGKKANERKSLSAVREEVNRLGGRFQAAFLNWRLATQKWVIGSRVMLTAFIIRDLYNDSDCVKVFCISVFVE